MNTDKIWLGAVASILVAMATTGCTTTTAWSPAAAAAPIGGGGSIAPVAWYSDRVAPARIDHEHRRVERSRHGSSRSGAAKSR
jgi:hypothetical protein